MSVTFRDMTPGDIAAGLELCAAAGWNQTAREWQLFLALSPRGCRVAVREERVIGTVTTLDYGPFAWISMVLVRPEERGKGIGTELLREAMVVLDGHPCVRLDATPLGEPVYRKLGFAAEYGLMRLERPAGPAPAASGGHPIPLHSPDLAPLAALDHAAFDAERRRVLSWLIEGAPELAWAMPGGEGYVLGRHGRRFTQIGPIVANNDAAAAALLHQALAQCTERAVVVDAPTAKTEWLALLDELGFREQRPLLRMARGTPPPLRDPVFAIAGPELG